MGDAAKYLGFVLGPGARDLSWSKPLEKYVARSKLWGQAGLGLMLTMRAYATYIATVLLFVA